MKIPGFLLRRLYVKESLVSTIAGFQFQLKNSLGSGYARKLLPIELDNKQIPMSSTSFVLEGKEVSFDDVNDETPFTLAMNKITTIKIEGWHLNPGPHKILMRFEVAGLGTLAFDFTDVAQDV